ncbi:MAG TPA: hypothetical protein DDY43_06945 [Synechococcales bacterium UBA10510]|nr:hypothetical protein [Synechococcales bacterium UBA10510]
MSLLGIAGWRVGGLEGWRVGGMEGWMDRGGEAGCGDSGRRQGRRQEETEEREGGRDARCRQASKGAAGGGDGNS